MPNILIIDKDCHTFDIITFAFPRAHLVEYLRKTEHCLEDKLKRRPEFIFVAIEFVDKLHDFFRLFPDAPLTVTIDEHDLRNEGLKKMEEARKHGFDFRVCRKPLMIEQFEEIIASKAK